MNAGFESILIHSMTPEVLGQPNLRTVIVKIHINADKVLDYSQNHPKDEANAVARRLVKEFVDTMAVNGK